MTLGGAMRFARDMLVLFVVILLVLTAAYLVA